MMMKNWKKASAILFASTMLFTACSDDPNEDVANGGKASKLTVEQNKENLETEGINFVQNMSAVAELQTYDVIDQLMSMMNTSEEEPVYSALQKIKSTQTNPQQTVSLKSTSEADTGAKAEFDANTGIYVWNETIGDFEKTAESANISYSFEVGTQTATFVVSNFNVVEFAFDTLTIEEPTSLNSKLTLGATTLCEFNLEGEYYDNGTPKYLRETFNLEGFFLESVINLRDQTKVKSDNKFEYKGENIFAFGCEIDGNIDIDKAKESLDEYGEPSASQEVINNANAYFQIGNIKLDGLVNAKDLIAFFNEQELKFDNVDYEYTEADVKEEAAKLNQYIQTYIRYADSQEFFAKGEFYTETESYSYYNDYEEVTETDYYVELRVVYPDGSAVSADVFESGFADMVTEINELIVDLNTNYDMGMEEMVY